ncbi:MAG: imidazole glycerol phosphate synthase subunit HisH [Alphaproteobacteria bacterium]|nr:imidazole glycerol phosphate synthase subunit HisH [Alphaproteobacteria bacterium]
MHTANLLQIVDYDRCNIGSVVSALKRLEIPFTIARNPDEINPDVRKIILPGVSSFDSCVHALKASGFYDYFKGAENRQGKKILGICAGAQILFEGSEEGVEEGLGIFKGIVQKIKSDGTLRIPHLGWNYIKATASHPQMSLLDHINLEKRFYFSHSFHFPQSDHSVAFVDYGYKFPILVSNGMTTAVQFHPEKSYNQGMQLLKNFLSLSC